MDEPGHTFLLHARIHSESVSGQPPLSLPLLMKMNYRERLTVISRNMALVNVTLTLIDYTWGAFAGSVHLLELCIGLGRELG
ncbi:MAG: hypothetical protein A6F71_04960 [Cycloclasticus sp. symbiont of Poecilosclerida sp. M]|nr:MAG: hypothetical protein A6F71_04960 [Cycloclasticus sp. symbiont of Poecilosclerida sp. M]